MSIGVGSLPSRIHLDDDDAQIARLARSSSDDDDDGPRKTNGTTPTGKLPPSVRAGPKSPFLS